MGNACLNSDTKGRAGNMEGGLSYPGNAKALPRHERTEFKNQSSAGAEIVKGHDHQEKLP